ncbi:MAG: hypothetical protein JXR94_23200 [Candidatus Hydrogenedentes bacterium]|nr:hypothetical protein [Candidatus Hydrogenedentota bacterium]
MAYLILSIVFMALLGVIFRLGVSRGADPLGMNLGLRAVPALFMGVALVKAMPPGGLGAAWAVAGPMALVAGVFFWLSGVASLKAVNAGHLGVSWAVLRCSMVVPALASLFYWREVPLWPVSTLLVLRILGIAVTAGAVVFLSADRARSRRTETPGQPTQDGKPKAWLFWIAAAFLAQGAWEIALRATRSFPDNESRLLFITVVFAFASLITLPVMIAAKAPLGRKELQYGLLAGICAVFASGLRVWALRDLDGIIVFPATTISVTLLVQMAGSIVWHERIGGLGKAGFAAAIAGILLLTLHV